MRGFFRTTDVEWHESLHANAIIPLLLASCVPSIGEVALVDVCGELPEVESMAEDSLYEKLPKVYSQYVARAIGDITKKYRTQHLISPEKVHRMTKAIEEHVSDHLRVRYNLSMNGLLSFIASTPAAYKVLWKRCQDDLVNQTMNAFPDPPEGPTIENVRDGFSRSVPCRFDKVTKDTVKEQTRIIQALGDRLSGMKLRKSFTRYLLYSRDENGVHRESQVWSKIATTGKAELEDWRYLARLSLTLKRFHRQPIFAGSAPLLKLWTGSALLNLGREVDTTNEPRDNVAQKSYTFEIVDGRLGVKTTTDTERAIPVIRDGPRGWWQRSFRGALPVRTKLIRRSESVRAWGDRLRDRIVNSDRSYDGGHSLITSDDYTNDLAPPSSFTLPDELLDLREDFGDCHLGPCLSGRSFQFGLAKRLSEASTE